MAKKQEVDVTPANQGIRLWDHEHQQIKLMSVVQSRMHRDIYAEAYAQLVEKRRAWKPKSPVERFPWRASPQPGPNRKRLTVALLAFEVAELDEWASTDGIAGIDAYYTAVYEYIMASGPVDV